jgi:putative serine protease PepD
MRRTEFWKIVILSSILSAAIVTVLLRWPSPPSSRAEVAMEPVATTPVTPLREVQLTDDERINVSIYQKLGPSVVNITSTTIEYTWFFEAVPRQGVGSGIIIDSDGHIVTNFHVIQGAKLLEVTLFDETVREATVVGKDPINDLVVLKIDCPPAGCQPIPLGSNQNLEVGQKVLAIGNPFGLQRTLTTGIISSLGRSLKTQYGFVDDVIQTDAAINPGNSGGPLLNTRGEVIGINTAIFSRSGDSAGIGFAVPVNTLKRILPDLLEHGRVLRPWHGLRGRPLNARLSKALEAPVEEGFLVEGVEAGSSADQAGVRGGNRRAYYGNTVLVIGGDIVVELGGEPVRTGFDIMRVLEKKRPGDTTEVVFYRGQRRVETSMELIAQEMGRSFRF